MEERIYGIGEFFQTAGTDDVGNQRKEIPLRPVFMLSL